MRFSILIPVYNVEKYLEQCLKSVLSQDYKDFEVILVNDGSTDQSKEICKRFAESDCRIKFFDKANEGLLLTRRFSIRQAKGEYILFLDSDDYWDQGVLSKLDKEIASSDVDMVCYRFRVVTDEGVAIYEDVNVFPNRILFSNNNKEEFIKAFIESTRLNNVWLKCVRNTIIDKDADYRRFEDKKGEDILQSIALIRNANTILYINDVFVNYRMSPSGRGRNFKLKYVDDYDIVKYHVYSNLIDMGVSKPIIDLFLKKYIERLIGFLSMIAVSVDNYESFKAECNHIKKYTLFIKASESIRCNDLKSSCRNDYTHLIKQRYYLIYYLHIIKRKIKRALSH